MTRLSRRKFLDFSATALMTVSLCQLFVSRKVISAPGLESITKWLISVNELAHAVKHQEITALQWQSDMECLLRQMDLGDFFHLIDFEAIQQSANLPDEGEFISRVDFKALEGFPETLFFYRFITGFQKGRSIPPHGHDNLVSSFIVLKGNVHARHFNRIRDVEDMVFVEPSLDEMFTPGQCSTVSDIKDNVHWFTALDEGTFMFDFGVGNLDPHRVPAKTETLASNEGRTHKDSRIFLDINHPISRSNGSIAVPRIDRQEAYRIYG